VFVVPESLVKEADKPALGWLDKSLLSLDPDKVTKVQITGPTPDEAVTLARDGANWKAEGAAFAVDKPTAEALVTTARPAAGRPARRLRGRREVGRLRPRQAGRHRNAHDHRDAADAQARTRQARTVRRAVRPGGRRPGRRRAVAAGGREPRPG
jgi:hypothetical protein